MTPEEAIKILEKKKEYSERITDNFLDYSMGEIKEADQTIEICDMAISVIKEIQQYREIGTVEECRKAVEKQKAKKIVYESDSVFCDGFTHYRMGKCPVCDRYYNSSDEVNYCSKCGQALMNENLEGMENE